MDWKTALPLFLGSSVLAGVISGLIAQGVPIWRERRARRRLGDFSALRLALMLEDYAGQCSELYSDVRTFSNSDGHAGKQHGGLILLPEYPDDIAWHALGTKLTEKVLSFRAIRNDAGLLVNHEWDDNPFQDEHSHFIGSKAVETGLKAIVIAEQLRKECRLSHADEGREWSTKTTLVHQMEEVTQLRTEYEAQQVASRAHLNALGI